MIYNKAQVAHLSKRYGPGWAAVMHVIDVHIPHLTRDRAQSIMLMARLATDGDVGYRHAFEAARSVTNREQQMVNASEDMRKAIWDVVWDSSWADAWHLSWVVSRLGLGLATLDLVNGSDYGVGDYMSLVGPWLTGGFGDMPIPQPKGLEDAA